MSKNFLAPFIGVVAAMTAGTVIVGSETAAQESASNRGEPVLLELFTSQGCSSCPPADRVAAKLDREGKNANGGVVVISRPVTYWDRLGWKDTLASESNTQLQRAYAMKGLQGRNGVYTPQVVSDGTFGVVGSQENALRVNIAKARRVQTAALRSKRLASGAVAVGIAGPSSQSGELVLIAVKREAKVAIGRGENSGRNIAYTNVVRSEKVIGNWNGAKQGIQIKAADLKVKGADRYAVVLREPNAGKVLAAGWIS